MNHLRHCRETINIRDYRPRIDIVPFTLTVAMTTNAASTKRVKGSRATAPNPTSQSPTVIPIDKVYFMPHGVFLIGKKGLAMNGFFLSA